MTFGNFQLADPRGENLICAAPMLPSRDLKKTAKLYAALGFATVLIPDGESYLIIRKEWVELHIGQPFQHIRWGAPSGQTPPK